MRLRSWGLLCAVCCLCVASTCPTPDSYLPNPIRAPAFTSISITAIKSGGGYRQAARLQWELPGKDSLPVSQFVILRKKQISDTAYTVLHYGIPDSQFLDWDILSPADWPGQGTYTKFWYRVFALDTQGQSGDTSAADSAQLSWPPTIVSPVDTLFNGLFKWSTILYRGGYYTYLYLWSDSLGLLWTSPQPSEPIYGHETPDSQSIILPAPPAPLAPGKYYCGVKVLMPGENIQSMALRQFYAR
jgi:hypothetical protein